MQHASPIETPETESLDEQRFREISAKLTAVNVALEEAKEARNKYRYGHPIRTLEVQSQLAILEGEIERQERELQALLAPYSEAKARVEGW